MTYLASFIAAAVVFALGAAFLIACVCLKNRHSTAAERIRLAAAAIMAAGACFGLILTVIGVVAKTHGAEDKIFRESSWTRVAEMNRLSHKIETKTPPQNTQLFVYVRYGCGDCMAVSEKLAEAVHASGLPFAGWYSTRTDIGRQLLDKYPVEAVPMLVWLDKDGWAETCDPALTQDDGSIIFNAAAVDAFFQKIKSSEAADLMGLAETLAGKNETAKIALNTTISA